MAQLLVRNISKEVSDKLKARAERHGRSLQAELKLILEEAAAESDMDNAVGKVDEIFRHYKTAGRKFDDSADMNRRERDR